MCRVLRRSSSGLTSHSSVTCPQTNPAKGFSPEQQSSNLAAPISIRELHLPFHAMSWVPWVSKSIGFAIHRAGKIIRSMVVGDDFPFRPRANGLQHTRASLIKAANGTGRRCYVRGTRFNRRLKCIAIRVTRSAGTGNAMRVGDKPLWESPYGTNLAARCYESGSNRCSFHANS